MRTPYTSIAAILMSVLALIAGNALLNTLVPLRGKLEGFSSVSLGLLGSVFFAGMLTGTLLGPAIIRRVGHVKAYAIFSALAMIVAVAYPLVVSPLWWIGLRAVIGFAFAGLYGVIDGWVQGKAENEHRGQMASAYQFVHFIAVAAGQMLLTTADPMQFSLFAVVGMLFALSIIPFSLSTTEPPPLPETAALELGWLFKNAPVSAIAALGIGGASGSFWSLFPVFGTSIGMPTKEIAWFLTATIIGSAVAIWPIGRISDRMDRRLVLAAMILIAGIIETVLTIFGRLPGLFMGVLGFLLGTVAMTQYSVAIAHANDRGETYQSVTIASGLLFLYSVGAIFGPLLAALLMERIGPQALFLFMALTHAAVLAVTIFRIRSRAPALERRATDVKLPV
ncbi:MAG: MFS transporter [Beijerinckiaceae bacterium]